MSTRQKHLVFLISIFITLSFACSPREKEQEVSLDAGPSPRPLFLEFEDLKWGMTEEEVVEVWGEPNEDGNYTNKGGYKEVSVGFSSVPSSRNVHPEVKRAEGDDRPFRFLIFISLKPEDIKPKDTFRAELVSNYGEPLSDPRLLAPMYCESPICEVFRAAECTMLIARWEPADEAANLPERLYLLTYALAPDSLIMKIPRTKWSELRGSIPPSLPPELKAKVDGFSSGFDGIPVKEVTELIGLPNLYLEEAPGQGNLYYFWLTGSNIELAIAEGRLQSVIRIIYEEDLR